MIEINSNFLNMLDGTITQKIYNKEYPEFQNRSEAQTYFQKEVSSKHKDTYQYRIIKLNGNIVLMYYIFHDENSDKIYGIIDKIKHDYRPKKNNRSRSANHSNSANRPHSAKRSNSIKRSRSRSRSHSANKP